LEDLVIYKILILQYTFKDAGHQCVEWSHMADNSVSMQTGVT